VGVRHCVAMCNATVALEILIRALDLRGEVIVPSFTFVATAHALQWQEITPVFCDVDPATHCIDPAKVAAMITPKTAGIIGVHTWGRPCDVAALKAIAERHRLALLFDAAHAFGCSYRGCMIGNFGAAEVFSFHATKFINSFEGGCVATNDGELAERMRLMRNFGFAGYDNVIYIGTNGKMSEPSAAMGLTSLESLDEFVTTNRSHYHLYRECLASLPGIEVAAIDGREKANYQYVVLELDAEKAMLTRDSLVALLHAENVLARRYFYPGCHRMEPYRSYQPHARLMLPATELLCGRVIVLPTGAAVGRGEIERICDVIHLGITHGRAVQARMSPTD
jgi:dTDP-4-amino-4,6-dideoxygalactose transaminase